MLKPPGATVQPTNPNVHSETRGRLLRDEQRATPPEYVPRFCITAVNPSPITESVTTQRWWPWLGAVDLEFVTIDLDSPSGDVNVQVRRSGAIVVEFTGSGDGRHPIGVSERWTPGDFLDVLCNGTVSRVDVQMWFRGQGGGGLVFAVDGGGGG